MHIDRKAKFGFENLKMLPGCRHEAVNGSFSFSGTEVSVIYKNLNNVNGNYFRELLDIFPLTCDLAVNSVHLLTNGNSGSYTRFIILIYDDIHFIYRSWTRTSPQTFIEKIVSLGIKILDSSLDAEWHTFGNSFKIHVKIYIS